ncbi:ATP-dependent Clp protease proteolytic subunit [Bradyrhizobium septentrionale]|uniref:ATP-dependent Clp protease proteolytic subunit n=2 Tax=Bradyrhizobium septentrionale TaxID=1404411 RepID=A0ABZ2NNU4_9BRAD
MLIVAALLATAVCRVQAGDVSGRVECDKRTLFCYMQGVTITGEIDETTTAKLRRLLEELDLRSLPGPDDRGSTHVKLNSPGGSVAEAMAIGRLFRKYRMGAVVEPGALCASSCVLIYAGAVYRLGYNKKALIGIHQPYFPVPRGQISPEAVRNAYTAMLTNIRTYLTEMNVSPQLADEMLKTAPSDVRYLSAKEQEKFGLTIIDPIELETTSLQQAQELGISRREHIRREALSRSQCPADASFGDCYQQVMKTGSLPLVDLSRFGTPVD